MPRRLPIYRITPRTGELTISLVDACGRAVFPFDCKGVNPMRISITRAGCIPEPPAPQRKWCGCCYQEEVAAPPEPVETYEYEVYRIDDYGNATFYLDQQFLKQDAGRYDVAVCWCGYYVGDFQIELDDRVRVASVTTQPADWPLCDLPPTLTPPPPMPTSEYVACAGELSPGRFSLAHEWNPPEPGPAPAPPTPTPPAPTPTPTPPAPTPPAPPPTPPAPTAPTITGPTEVITLQEGMSPADQVFTATGTVPIQWAVTGQGSELFETLVSDQGRRLVLHALGPLPAGSTVLTIVAYNGVNPAAQTALQFDVEQEVVATAPRILTNNGQTIILSLSTDRGTNDIATISADGDLPMVWAVDSPLFTMVGSGQQSTLRAKDIATLPPGRSVVEVAVLQPGTGLSDTIIVDLMVVRATIPVKITTSTISYVTDTGVGMSLPFTATGTEPIQWSLEGHPIGISLAGNGNTAVMTTPRSLPVGVYVFWVRARQPDTNTESSLQVTVRVNQVAAPGPTPPPGPTPTPPPAGDAPWPTEDQYSTRDANGLLGNSSWERVPPRNDWRSAPRSGRYMANNNCWDVGTDKYDLQFVPNWDAAISGTQFQQRVGLGTAVGNRVSAVLETRLPSKAVVQSTDRGADSEVVTFPELIAGRLPGWSHYQEDWIPTVPIQFKDITSFKIGASEWNFDDTNVHGPGWIAHDMRAFNTSNLILPSGGYPAIIDCEILVTRKHFPASHNVTNDSSSGPMVWEGTLGGVFYKVFFMYGASYPGCFLVQFRAVNGAPDEMDFYPIIRWLLTRRYNEFPQWTGNRCRGQGYNDTIVNGNHWWSQVVTGIETEYGRYRLGVKNFYCEINEPPGGTVPTGF